MVKKKVSKKKVTKKKGSNKLTDEQKLQNLQKREIRNLLKNIGFSFIPRIDGKHFTFKGRQSEMDDIFYLENVILFTEYTVGTPKKHLLEKNYIFNLISDNKKAFIDFLYGHESFNNFKEFYENKIQGKYTINQLQIKILYCSRQEVKQRHKNLSKSDVVFFDFHIVKYFESLAKVIKKSSKFEFLDFLNIPFSKFSENVSQSSSAAAFTFSGHLLPEENSSFNDGYKIVSFYIDANALLRRAYVLRQNGWKDINNIGHYQRMFIKSKISGMRKYLFEKDRVFINNIITSISVDKVKLFDEKDNLIVLDDDGNDLDGSRITVTPAKIEINDETNIIGLIDGQHRTYAYHEGDDSFETKIKELRKKQNLLVTGILFPKSESAEAKLKFEANLFMEINANQTGASGKLKQEIELMINQFSTISISKRVLNELGRSGALEGRLEKYWYEKGKLKTVSIVSYGLKPLLKLEEIKSKDSIFSIWSNVNKQKLKTKNSQEYELLDEYIKFSVSTINDLLNAFKSELSKAGYWRIDRADDNAVLNVSTVNGILNTLRLIIQNGKVSNLADYQNKLSDIKNFNFNQYKSSQYRKMGEDIYNKYFK